MEARMRTSIVVVLAAALALPAVARGGDATGAFAPYEDLLEVVADLTWHLRDDTYRFPPPKDPTGHDVFRLSLQRLENWEKRYPGRMRDVTAVARAEALEHLGEYTKAADLYDQTAALPSPLADRAREGAERARVFANAAAMPEERGDLDATLLLLRAKLDAWAAVVGRYDGTPWEPMALAEEERLETTAARVVVDHRETLDKGDEQAERALRFLIQKHSDSKALAGHILALADLYADFARDYVRTHERPLAFEENEFVSRADRALDAYRKVATWDGSREKPEAQARYAALDAYKTAVLARYR
jgi:tetratricopeptide (TPR) repeat protein